MDAPAGLGGGDDRRQVERVAIDRHAALERGKRNALGACESVIGAEQGGELGAGGMSHHENTTRIAAMRGDVAVHPAERAGDVAGEGGHVDLRQQPVVDGDEDAARGGEEPRLQLHVGLAPGLPAAAVNPEDHRKILRPGGRVDVERVALMDGRCVRNVARDREARFGRGGEGGGEQRADREGGGFHGVGEVSE